ncbi:MAG: discoidin domain-containing protein [Saprospiraceae bacterium]
MRQVQHTPAITATTANNACPATTVNLITLANTGSVPSGSTLVWSLNNPPLSATDTLTTAQASAVSVTDTYYAFYRSIAEACFSPADMVSVTIIDCNACTINYLQNSSFENYTQCPNLSTNPTVDFAVDWYTSAATPQLMVNRPGICESGAPANYAWGPSTFLTSGHTGTNWVGGHLGEAWAQNFDTALPAGTYQVCFWGGYVMDESGVYGVAGTLTVSIKNSAGTVVGTATTSTITNRLTNTNQTWVQYCVNITTTAPGALINFAPSGTGYYLYMDDVSLMATGAYCCNTLTDPYGPYCDNDGDGVLNSEDLDDDNDGIKDVDELNCNTVNVSKTGVVVTKPSNVTYTFKAGTTIQNVVDGVDNNNNVLYSPSGTLVNSPLMVFQFPTPVKLTSIEFGHYLNQQLFSNTTKYKIQASNDGVTWVDVSSELTYNNTSGNQTSYNGNTASFPEPSTAYTYYRMFGTSPVSSGGGWLTEVYFTSQTCALTDVDNDGIPNQYDLDSDGDGCPDAIEGASYLTSSQLNPDGSLAGAVNPLGIPTVFGSPQTAGTSLSETTFDPSCANVPDSDGDGIVDTIDLDDDNDGVLDSEETTCSTVSVSNSDVEIFRPSTISYTGNTDALIDGDMVGGALYNPTGTLTNSPLLQFNFSEPKRLTSIEIANYIAQQFYSNTTKYKIQASNDGTTWVDVSPVLTYNNTSKVESPYTGNTASFAAPTTAYSMYRIYGTSPVASGGGYSTEVFFKEIVCTDIDTDGDGIPNRLETDSDGDGCTDAFEAGTSTTNVATVGTTYGPNGFADNLETSGNGIYTGTYTYSNATNNTIHTCPVVTDTDGDGNPDSTDPAPNDPCTGYVVGSEVGTGSLWASADCDGDGVTNGAEKSTAVGPATDPYNPCSLNTSEVTLLATSTGDCDGDGVTNAAEINTTGPSDPQTDPTDPCAYNEAEQGTPSAAWNSADCDGDGNPNGTDPNPLVPTAVDDAFDAPFGTATTYDILTNDDFLENDGNTITREGGDAGGTVSFDPVTGNISYTPLTSEIGTTVTVVYEVCQGTVCDQATVTITVPYHCPTITNSTSDNLNPTGCSVNDGSIMICGLIANQTGYVLSYSKNGAPQTPATLTANASGCITLTGLSAGTYSLLDVTHPTICPDGSNILGPVTLVGPAPATIVKGTTINPSACGVADGFIQISGLTAGTEYTLTYDKNGATQTPIVFTASSSTYTIQNLTSGSYTNIKVSNNGCESNSLTHTLTDPTTATINLTAQSNPTLCSGNDGSFTVSGLAPGTYTLYYMKNGLNQTPITFTVSGTSYTVYGLTAGGYTNIRVVNSGCTSNSVSATLSDPGAPIISLGTPNQPSACGMSDGSYTITGLTPGVVYTLKYRKDGISQTPITFTATSSSYTISGLEAAIYSSINVNQGGCISNSLSQVLSDPGAAVIAAAVTAQPTICGANDGTITVSGLTSGLSYTLNYVYNGVQQASSTFTASGTTYVLSGLTAGSYTGINVTQGGCTSNSVNVMLSNPNGASIDGFAVNAQTCNPGNDGKIILTGLSQGVTYTLTYDKDGVAQSPISINATTTSYVINGLTVGSYTNIMVDQAGCISNVISEVVDGPIALVAPTLNPTTLTNECPATVADLTTVAATNNSGYTLTWHTDTPATAGNLVSDAENVTAGTYYAAFYNSITQCYGETSSLTVTIIGCTDTDGDGIADNVDLDDDNDGILDTVENGQCSPSTESCDTDGDGIPNRLDLDSDNDGILDLVESLNGPAIAADTNGDGTISPSESPAGADGVPLAAQGTEGSNPPAPNDQDGDGKPNPYDLDSDNDGINDLTENVAPGGVLPTDANSDGVVDGPDADGDGIMDSVDANDGVFGDPDLTDNPYNTDGTTESTPLPDYLDLDSDNDGINDLTESGNPVTDANSDGVVDGPDADGDGIMDSADANDGVFGDPDTTDTPTNTDGSGDIVPDYRDLDSDNDGINDIVESGTGLPDTNQDGIVDGTDADNDGINDPADANDSVYGDPDTTDTPNTDVTDGPATVTGTDPDNDGIVGPADGSPTTYGDAVNCVTPVLKVLLEGPYLDNGSNGATMTTKLNDLGYLPGQDPTTFFGIATPAGQPYDTAPWNYSGTEGDGYTTALGAKAGYPSTTTDWVLVSLRETLSASSTVCTRAALLLNDGTVQMVNGFDCCQIDVSKTYYVVVEHRNHLIVMSHQKVAIVGGSIQYDFTTQQSYQDLLGFGQKLINGKYVMHAGNGQQVISSSADTDINVNDKDLWQIYNGDNSSYYINDFELNGDVNVQDKNLWLINNGKFTDVPR